MSWSVYTVEYPITDASGETIADGVNAKIDELSADNPGYREQFESVEVKEQMAVAIRAAGDIVVSGALGEGPYRINLSGHANPDHQPGEGWAGDMISVSVYCA